MSIEPLQAEILTEIENLQKLLSEFNDYTESKEKIDRWDERVAVGKLLHDFYNGVENIFRKIVLRVDEYPQILQGEDSHRELLEYVTQPVNNTREPVISDELKELLDEYRRFRHAFRHTYGHQVSIEKMKAPIEKFPGTCEQFVREIKEFLELPP